MNIEIGGNVMRAAGLACSLTASRLLGIQREPIGGKGWLKTRHLRIPMDQNGEPLPWYTYPAISFLATKALDGLSVFEFGSGYSTLWWARRVKHVTSCEHNPEWFQTMQGKLPANVEYVFHHLPPSGNYTRALLNHTGEVHVLVIDGRERVQCLQYSLDGLASNAVVIWDNSDRPKYRPGFARLREEGFHRQDFPGFGPINFLPWCTSVFYRTENCLGLEATDTTCKTSESP